MKWEEAYQNHCVLVTFSTESDNFHNFYVSEIISYWQGLIVAPLCSFTNYTDTLIIADKHKNFAKL